MFFTLNSIVPRPSITIGSLGSWSAPKVSPPMVREPIPVPLVLRTHLPAFVFLTFARPTIPLSSTLWSPEPMTALLTSPLVQA